MPLFDIGMQKRIHESIERRDAEPRVARIAEELIGAQELDRTWFSLSISGDVQLDNPGKGSRKIWPVRVGGAVHTSSKFSPATSLSNLLPKSSAIFLVDESMAHQVSRRSCPRPKVPD